LVAESLLMYSRELTRSQIDLIYSFMPCILFIYLGSILILSSHVRPPLSNGILPLPFLRNSWHVLLTYLMRATDPADIITLYLLSGLFSPVVLSEAIQIPHSYGMWLILMFYPHTACSTVFCFLYMLAVKCCLTHNLLWRIWTKSKQLYNG
jgi:hypothetical protein